MTKIIEVKMCKFCPESRLDEKMEYYCMRSSEIKFSGVLGFRTIPHETAHLIPSWCPLTEKSKSNQ